MISSVSRNIITIFFLLITNLSATSSEFNAKKCNKQSSFDNSLLTQSTKDLYDFVSSRVDFDNYVEDGKGCDSTDRELGICVYNFAKAAKPSDILEYVGILNQYFIPGISGVSNNLINLYNFKQSLQDNYSNIKDNFDNLKTEIDAILGQINKINYKNDSEPINKMLEDVNFYKNKVNNTTQEFTDQDENAVKNLKSKVENLMAKLPLIEDYSDAEYQESIAKFNNIVSKANSIEHKYYQLNQNLTKTEAEVQKKLWLIRQLMDWIVRNSGDWLNIYNEHNLSNKDITDPHEIFKDIVTGNYESLNNAQNVASNKINSIISDYYFYPTPIIWNDTLFKDIKTPFEEYIDTEYDFGAKAGIIGSLYGITDKEVLGYLQDKTKAFQKLAACVNNFQNSGSITMDQVGNLKYWFDQESQDNNIGSDILEYDNTMTGGEYNVITNTLKLYNGSLDNITDGVRLNDIQKLADYIASLDSSDVIETQSAEGEFEKFLKKAEPLLEKYQEIKTKLENYESQVLDSVSNKDSFNDSLVSVTNDITNELDINKIHDQTIKLKDSLKAYAESNNMKNLTPCDKITLKDGEGVEIFRRDLGLSSGWNSYVFDSIYLKTRVDTQASKICLDLPSPSGDLPIECRGLKAEPVDVESNLKYCAASSHCLNSTYLNNHYMPSITGRMAVCLQSTLRKFFTGEELCENPENSLAGKINAFTKFQKDLRNIIFIALTLYVVVFGLKSIIDLNSGNEDEVFKLENLFWFVMKVILVMYFAAGYQEAPDDEKQRDRHEAVISEVEKQSIYKSGMTELVMPLATKGPFIFASWVASAYTKPGFGENNVGFCGFSDLSYPENWEMMRFWDALDCRITYYLGISYYQQSLLQGKIDKIPDSDAEFSDGYLNFPIFDFALNLLISMYLVHFLLMVPAVYMLLIMFLTFATKLITYIIVMYVLIYISPIIIPMVLFDYTKRYFDQWLKLMISFFLQPMVIASFLLLILTLFDYLFFSGQCVAARGDVVLNDGNIVKYFTLSKASGSEFPGIFSDIKCDNSLGVILSNYLSNHTDGVNAMLFTINFLDFDGRVEADLLLQLSALLVFSFLGFNFIQMADQFAAKLTGGVDISNISRDMSAHVPAHQVSSKGGQGKSDDDGSDNEDGAKREGGEQSSGDKAGSGDSSDGSDSGDKASGGSGSGDASGDKVSK